MKLRVSPSYWFPDQYKVEKYTWLWGWEDYDGLLFKTYNEALEHAKEIRMLNG